VSANEGGWQSPFNESCCGRELSFPSAVPSAFTVGMGSFMFPLVDAFDSSCVGSLRNAIEIVVCRPARTRRPAADVARNRFAT
jgi:hypothetical protein